MKKYIASIMVVAAALAMVSCSGEETPTPLYHSPAPFYMPADTATDATSQLRREFYSRTGSYLLFNDTIQKNYLGTDINGDDVYSCETLDLAYTIGYSLAGINTYSFSYVTDYESQKAMTDFIDEYVLYHFTGKIKPFLYFICKTITLTYRNGSVSSPYASSGQRGVAIAANYLLSKKRTESQKKAYAERILSAMIGQLANNYSEYFTDFYAYSSSYYNNYWTYYGDDRDSTLASLGFIGIGTYAISCPGQSEDLNQYALATIQYSADDWAKKYADYPIVVEKYNFMRRVLTELGFVYDE
jgi:hypothetical protein